MRDTAIRPLATRLHSLIGRLSLAGGYIVAQADVAEGVARIVRLERALCELLSHIDRVDYRNTCGGRLGDATPVVSRARMLLAEGLPPT